MARDKTVDDYLRAAMGAWSVDASFRMPNPFMPSGAKRKARPVEKHCTLSRFKHVAHSLKRLRAHGRTELDYDADGRLLVDVDLEVVDTTLRDRHAKTWRMIRDAAAKVEEIKAKAGATK